MCLCVCALCVRSGGDKAGYWWQRCKWDYKHTHKNINTQSRAPTRGGKTYWLTLFFPEEVGYLPPGSGSRIKSQIGFVCVCVCECLCAGPINVNMLKRDERQATLHNFLKKKWDFTRKRLFCFEIVEFWRGILKFTACLQFGSVGSCVFNTSFLKKKKKSEECEF